MEEDFTHQHIINNMISFSTTQQRSKGQTPSERELIGGVGVVLKASQGFDVLPHFEYVLQESPVFLLLTVPQLPGVPALFGAAKSHNGNANPVLKITGWDIIWRTDLISRL